MKILTRAQAKFITDLAVSRLAEYLKKNGIKSIILGISGGLDSAVVAILGLRAVDILRKTGYECQPIYDFIGIESDPNDLLNARKLAYERIFILNEFDYTEWYRSSPIRLPTHNNLPRIKVARGNLKCRIRLLHLYDRAQLYDGIVLDTDDLSEFLMGFWTKHGDVGDVKLIQQLTKDEVHDLGEYLGVPEIILQSAPGDGLGVTASNHASDQLGMEYLKTDYIISSLIRFGFDINGPMTQIEEYSDLTFEISRTINESEEKVVHVVRKSLRTAFKRVGDEAILLLPSRTEMGLPKLGTSNFNSIRLKVIKNQ